HTREAKRGPTMDSGENRRKLRNGAPQVTHKKPPAIVTATTAPPRTRHRRDAMISSGMTKTISLNRSAKASPAKNPAKNGQRSTTNTLATTQHMASVRG